MKNYLSALKYCFENGEFVKSRAGNVKKAFGYQMRFDLKKGFPAVTTKKLAWKAMVSELLWFLEGSNDERRLAEILYEDERKNLEDKIKDICKTFSLKNSKQEYNLIETLKINCRKTVKDKTGKKPYTNINLVRI